ncbi:MAG: hypothetical protein OEY49_15540 [Candidatus Heimdallarchaeota archaeon]|nr:hypothetical protein [Candidatus Heimdallarchaeota archaeon]
MEKYLRKLVELSEAVIFKELGTTKTKLNPLENLGLIEFTKIVDASGNTPAKDNGVKLTPFGLLFLNMKDNETLDTHTQILEIKQTILETKKNLTTLNITVQKQLSELSSSIAKSVGELSNIIRDELTNIDRISAQLSSFTVTEDSLESTEVSNDIDIELIREGYMENKKGDNVAIQLELVIKHVMERTGKSVEEVKRAIKDYYLKQKVNLYAGLTNRTYGIVIDRKFYGLIKVD